MRDALRAARLVPAFLGAAGVHLIEISAALRDAQRKTLASASGSVAEGITWHGGMEEVPEGAALIIANEFLDALPIRQLVFEHSVWRERVVDLDESGGLRFNVGPPVDFAASEQPKEPPQPGAILELREGEEELVASLARRRSQLVALFIDYGPEESAYGDTLQAVRNHAWVDPLKLPGHADLTAHVRFARLASRARDAGFAVDGPMAQSEFLGRLGVAERAARLMAANPDGAGEIEGAVQRLISPTGMGSLFKVLAIRSRGLPPTIPFV